MTETHDSPPDLVTFFETLAREIPESDAEEHIALSDANLPVPPRELTTGAICITSGYRRIHGRNPVEGVRIEADKPALRALGLLVLSSIFHRQPASVSLCLTHPRATLRRVLIGHDWDEAPDMPGFHESPLRHNFSPEWHVNRHPWTHRPLAPRELPVLYLTPEDLFSDVVELEGRVVGVGFGHCAASALLADLLLQLSLAKNQQDEIDLEGEWGFRGVGPNSVDISLYLPGSGGYLDAPVRGEPGWSEPIISHEAPQSRRTPSFVAMAGKGGISTLRTLWNEHLSATFPTDTLGDQIEGIDPVEVDSAAAGCIEVFLSGTRLDVWRTAILGTCCRDLAVLAIECPREDQRTYFRRLENLTRQVLETTRDASKRSD